MNTTADSHHYINISKQIYQNGFTSIWKNEQLVYWPPLYPIILSFFMNSDGSLHIRIFNFILYCLLVLIWEVLSRKMMKNQKNQLLFFVLFALSTNLLMISTFIWSELVFLLLFSLVILSFEKFLNNNQPRWLWISVIPAFLMLIQRNAGIFLIVPLYLSSLVFYPQSRRQVGKLAISFVVSILGFSIWNIKNILIENRFYMVRELVPYFTPFKNLSLLLNELGSTFYPALALYPVSVVISLILLALISWSVFRFSDTKFIKVLLLSLCCYLVVWIIIPGDPSNIGRFISVIVPMLLLVSVEAISLLWKRYNLPSTLMKGVIASIIVFSLLRITNNAFLWGGKENYLNFGEIHKNLFYEKSDRIIGRPSSE